MELSLVWPVVPRSLPYPLSFRTLAVLSLAGWLAVNSLALATAADVAKALAAIRQVGPAGENHLPAIAATSELSQLDAQSLPTVLQAMDGANPLAKNWLIGVAGKLADQGPLPVAALERFLADVQHDADARTWVFELLTRDDPDQKNGRLEQLLDDPAAELRYMAIEFQLAKLDGLETDTQLKLLTALLDAARHPAQIQSIAEKSKAAGQPVDLQRQFGFLPEWRVAGPFDNRDQSGFAVAYGPEEDLASRQTVLLDGSYPGKAGEVRWQPASTTADDGTLDFNAMFNNEKGSIVYAFTTFKSARAQACEVRLGCTNANQLWLNGERIISNEVYHTGAAIDQYVGLGTLQPGENTLLVKVCQNEQTDAWAQDWAFQLRLTDPTGKALRPAE